MHALSLSTRKAMVLTALLASLMGILIAAPAAFAQCAPGDAEYSGGIDGCEPDPGPENSPGGGSSPGGANSPGGGSSPGGNAGGSDGGARLGPDASVTGVDSGGGADSDSGGSSSGDDSGTSAGSVADKKASKKLDGRSLGEVLSGGTERVASPKPTASTDAGTRAAKSVSEDGGGAGLLWLLLALGAITAVAAGGVAVRRRQAQRGFGA